MKTFNFINCEVKIEKLTNEDTEMLNQQFDYAVNATKEVEYPMAKKKVMRWKDKICWPNIITGAIFSLMLSLIVGMFL